MALPREALDTVAPYCDIVERLDAVPPSARVRGMYLKTIEVQLERRDKLAPYRACFPDRRRWSLMRWHPVTDFLLRLAYAGALVASPENLHDGMREITRAYASDFATSLLGRTLLRLLARDPVRLSEQGLAARRQSANYGHWELIRHGVREIEMVYHNEYQWIESAIAGSAQGAFDACGVEATIETRLLDRFNGSTIIQW